MNAAPRISVLLPVYNGAAFLRTAIDSILGQTCADFELLILDDGSTDDSREIAASYADPRIRRVDNGQNLGLIATLNRGLELARGEFIARMDADDISLPRRLARQVAFLEGHPKVGLCGTWFERFSRRGSLTVRMPEQHGPLRLFLLFDNPFLHSSIMLRRSLVERHGLRYDPAYPHSEDYELWARCAELTQLANLPDVLVRYRDHPANISHRFGREQDAANGAVRARLLRSLGLVASATDLARHHALAEMELREWTELAWARDWLDRILAIGGQRYGAPAMAVRPYLARLWYGCCGKAADQGWQTWRLFRSSPVGRAAALEWQVKLGLRCLLRRPIPANATAAPA